MKRAIVKALFLAGLINVAPASASVMFTDSAVPLSIGGFQVTQLAFSVDISSGGSCTDLGCVIDGLSFASTQGGGATAGLANLQPPSSYFHLSIVNGVLQSMQAIQFIDSGGTSWDLGLGSLDICATGTLPGCSSVASVSAPASGFVASSTPEPGTLALLTLGLAGLAASRRRKQ